MTRVELSRNIWMSASSVGVAIVVYLIARPPARVAAKERDLSVTPAVARLVGPQEIELAEGSAFERNIPRHPVKAETVTIPLLTVTASVAAHSRRGSEKPQDRWQFQSADVSGAYADWRRAQNDVEYGTKQLEKTRELGKAQIARYTDVYERLKKLVEETGTEAVKDLRASQADLLQAQLQAQKDEFDAESAVNTALRNRAAGARALVQAGIDPSSLDKESDVAIILAQVPEVQMRGVKEGLACIARFYGIPDRTFPGHITRIVSTLASDRRTLRVLFELEDPDLALKPGMFADVGIGTDSREALLIPPEALIHVGRKDYVLARQAPGPWKIQEVDVGESHGELIEARRGLSGGGEVMGRGAILLKPYLIQALGK